MLFMVIFCVLSLMLELEADFVGSRFAQRIAGGTDDCDAGYVRESFWLPARLCLRVLLVCVCVCVRARRARACVVSS